jgi:phage shock protein C
MAHKKLHRSNNQLVAGVCAGLAEYFDHDPTLWRLGFAFFLVLTGVMPGLLLYIIGWVVMPKGYEVVSE